MEVFFYGLFMDQTILQKNGIVSARPRMARLQDYQLKIGNRASLIPSQGDLCYGLLMKCNSKSIRQLYSEASVADYLPEEVTVVDNQDNQIKATCYNLPPELITGTNISYAQSLYDLAKQIGFPETYLQHIEQMTR